MLLMFWIFLTSQVLLLGAELSYAYATLIGSRRAAPAGAAEPAQPAPSDTAPAAEVAPPDRTARAAGVGVLVGALGTLALSAAALALGIVRMIRALRRG